MFHRCVMMVRRMKWKLRVPAHSSPKLLHPAGDVAPERGQCRGTCHVPGLSLIPQPDKVCRSSVFPGSLAAS